MLPFRGYACGFFLSRAVKRAADQRTDGGRADGRRQHGCYGVSLIAEASSSRAGQSPVLFHWPRTRPSKKNKFFKKTLDTIFHL
jgi:hypothetical protein